VKLQINNLKRNVFQASICATAQRSRMFVNNPTNQALKEEDGKLLPIWISLPFAKDVFHLDARGALEKSTCSLGKGIRRN